MRRRSEPDAAERILRARRSAGEISDAEYRERAALLRGSRPRRRSRSGVPAAGLAVIAGFATIAVLALFAAALGGWWGMMPGHMGSFGADSRGTGASSAPLAGADEVAVEAGDLWFRPATLTVRAGQAVNIVLTNEGRVFHDFTVDGADFQLNVNPGDSVSGALRIDAPGEYRFYCSVPGHASAGMNGTLVVESP